ncbi:MAG: NACHT domain-containing protein [Cyanobacteria bacterium P01_A01_bin.3]
MPKQSYGPVTQERSRSLLFALLDFANDGLDADERQLDLLRSYLQIHWQSPQRLVVRTKLRHLQTLSKLAQPNSPLSLPQLKIALKHLADVVGMLEDNRTVKRGSDQWHFTLTLWSDRWNRDENHAQFDLAWETARSDRTTDCTAAKRVVSTESDIDVDSGINVDSDSKSKQAESDRWQQLCREALDTQLTSNPLTAGDGIAFELGDVYVPLGMVERTGRSQDEDDVAPQIYAPGELVAQLATSDVAERIAIVGEPGAGKTTSLQQVAIALLHTPEALPIWISLADLDNQSLETYLTQTWLRQAFKAFQVPQETVEEFAVRVQQGRVWLLLDAVDELGGDGSRTIARLARDLKGWLSDARVILTCRVNIWDAGKNALAGCRTFRCLSFSDGGGLDSSASKPANNPSSNQVEEFIRRWFQRDRQQGESLCRRLEQRRLRRVRQLVRHPLYLALLCRTWASAKGELPATKTSLYRQFAIAHYEWKQDLFPTTLTQRQELNEALSQLALAAMTQSPPSFRLRRSVLERQFHGKLDLLSLALQLGWLNPVGMSDRFGEPIYSFYHPTFQEYFAAQAVPSWQDFMDGGDEDDLAPVFAPIWYETILLWLGRDDIAAGEKAGFIDRLLAFDDRCGSLYSYRAKFLAVRGLAEIDNYPDTATLVQQLIRWRFAKSEQDLQLPGPIVEQAGVALARTDPTYSIPALEAFVQSAQLPLEQWLAAHSLGKNHDPGNAVAISTLTQLLQGNHSASFRLNFIRSLEAIDPGNPLVPIQLTDILKTETKPSLLRKAANRLAKVEPDNPLPRQTIARLLAETDDPRIHKELQANLDELTGQSPAPAPASQPKSRASNHKTSNRSKNEPDRDKAIANLLAKLETANDLSHRIRIAGKLGQYCPTHPNVSETLLDALSTSRSKAMLKSAVDRLRDTMDGDLAIGLIPAVRDIYLCNPANSERSRQCYRLLWYWSADIPLAIFQKQWQLPVTRFRTPISTPMP